MFYGKGYTLNCARELCWIIFFNKGIIMLLLILLHYSFILHCTKQLDVSQRQSSSNSFPTKEPWGSICIAVQYFHFFSRLLYPSSKSRFLHEHIICSGTRSLSMVIKYLWFGVNCLLSSINTTAAAHIAQCSGINVQLRDIQLPE